MKTLIRNVIIIFVFIISFNCKIVKPANVIFSNTEIPYEKVSFQTNDGVMLSGMLIHSPESKAIIICLHVYKGNKDETLPLVSFLYPDFSLFLFDFRAHGESEGDIIYFGLKEYLDVKAAIDFLKNEERTKNLKIGIWGCSLGASVGIIASSKYEEIKCLVADSGFANISDTITFYSEKLGSGKNIFASVATFLVESIFKYDLIENSPENCIDKVTCPVLIIHSKEDEIIPFSHAEILYNKVKGEKELFVIDGKHAVQKVRYSQGYRDKVKEFFCKYLQ